MNRYSLPRRTVLKATGSALAIGLIAGCSSDDERPDDGDGGGGGGGGEDHDFGGWFDDANNYDGLHDFTGEDEVSVDVGAGSDGFAYDPAAIKVDIGTTVVWEWTGDGGAHDVATEDGSFESELTDEQGATFEHTFEEAGTYEYFCTPHVDLGMKGAVVVE